MSINSWPVLRYFKSNSREKGIFCSSASLFSKSKKYFGESAKFMLAYLGLSSLSSLSWQEHSVFWSQDSGFKGRTSRKKRTKGQIADAEDQLRSYYKRLEQFKSYQIATG